MKESAVTMNAYLTFFVLFYNDPKFSDRQVWASSVHPDQTAV